MTYFIAGEGRRLHGQTAPSELRDKFAMSIRQPIGVCSMITPWNFPMAIPSWKIIPALVCGNTVVFKPAELTPLSADQFRQGARRGRCAAGRREPGDRRPGGRRNADHASRCGGGLVHRIDRRRQAREPERRAGLQEGPSRDGRQERHHRHGRRGPRAGGRRLLVGRLRHDRTALHRGQPRRSSTRRSTIGSSSEFVEARARRLRVGDGLDAADADGAVDQREAAAEGHELRRDRQAGRRDDRVRRPAA